MTASHIDERGTVEVRSRAIVRIAEWATANVEGVERSPGSVTKRPLPRATAAVTGDRVRITVDAAVEWPMPVSVVARRIRDAVTEDVSALGGLAVESVDVAVQFLAPERVATARRVQ